MDYKILIEKFIELIPSKDLKEAYKKDISEGNYPNWDIDDIISLYLNIYEWNIEKQIESLEEIIKYVNDNSKVQEINTWLNELKEKGSRYEFHKMPKNFYKYVVVKTLFKAGDLIKFPGNENKIFYGIVGDFDYDKVFGDISDVCYYSHTLSHDIDRDNPYKIYWSHNHPHKLEVERALESELDDELKDYLKFLRENVVFADSDKMFDEYDKKYKPHIKLNKKYNFLTYKRKDLELHTILKNYNNIVKVVDFSEGDGLLTLVLSKGNEEIEEYVPIGDALVDINNNEMYGFYFNGITKDNIVIDTEENENIIKDTADVLFIFEKVNISGNDFVRVSLKDNPKFNALFTYPDGQLVASNIKLEMLLKYIDDIKLRINKNEM